MKASDAIALTSRAEGLPMVLLEAMALKKPVVATAVGGVPEAIGTEGAGILMPEHSVPTFAEAILSILNDPAQARRMGELGEQRVRARFDIDRQVAELERLYDELLRGSP